METLLQLDKELLLWLNSFHSRFWDVTMMFFTRKEFWIPLYLIMVYYIYTVRKQQFTVWLLGLMLLIVLCDQVSGLLFKDVFQRLRPSHDPALKDIVHLVKGYRGGRYGFVSSHATNSFGFALFSSLLFRNRAYTVFVFVWSILISYTRIYLGVHFPGDVIGGMLLGLLLGWTMYRVVEWTAGRKIPFLLTSGSATTKLPLKAVYNIVGVCILEIAIICLVVRKLMKYLFF